VIRKGYADSPVGQIHHAECGIGFPVLLLHQTPRSWREFEAVLPLLGGRLRAVAVDMPGFGESPGSAAPMSIEQFADGVCGLVDHLGLDGFGIVGHHTGGVVAVEVAARLGERVRHLVLSATPFMTPQKRAVAHEKPRIDQVDTRPDGGHLTELWGRRRGFYAPGEEAFLAAFVADALRVGDRVEDGHHACRRYVMEERLPLVACGASVLSGARDHYATPSLQPMADHFGAEVMLLDGHVPLPEQNPGGFARAVLDAFAPHL
jgi:pimeloyl-ACP methyl ester carboxylesterase